jgi:CRISPR/Cas system CMR-associated protein Cmr5 small subunit
MFHKRIYKPIYPQKYVGDLTNIIMRSSWETKFAIWCDKNPSVIKWSSEETVIPYISPIDNRAHRYFIDFKIQIRNNDGNIKTYLVEIKPDSQTKPPSRTSRKTKRYIQEVMTWGVNDAKWKAANTYAKDRGWEFIVLTENHLGIK